MGLIKTFTVTAIISLGIAGAVFVIQNNNRLNQSQVLNQNPTPKPPELAQNQIIQETPGSTEKLTNLSQASIQETKNLTTLFTNKLAQTIVEANPNGPEILDGEPWLNTPDPDQISNDLITEAQKNFDPKSLRPIIQNSDLKISTDNSKAALINYLLAFNKIIDDAAGKFPPEIFTDPSSVNTKTFEILANIYQSSFDEFKKIGVPSSVLAIHKKEMGLLGTSANIYKNIKNYQEDPMVAILATQELGGLQKEFTALSEELGIFIKKSGING
ncbi:MAG: hypothetical protein Q7S73_01470 [bacterium]|nr:hypothetical protein [bacterium]